MLSHAHKLCSVRKGKFLETFLESFLKNLTLWGFLVLNSIGNNSGKSCSTHPRFGLTEIAAG